MDYFQYKNKELFAEDVSLQAIADEVGTPFYCYSEKSFESQFSTFANSVKKLNADICYSVKANSNIAVVATLAKLGAGADVVSIGELKRALVAGVPAKKIIFSGVGKTTEELKFAADIGIKQINIESEAELNSLSMIASSMAVKVDAALRVNPDIDAETHEKITTGKSENKFGIDFIKARKIFLRASDFPNINLSGIAIHIGSQLTNLEPYRSAYKKVAEFIKLLRADGVKILNLDLGGGLGIKYNDEDAPSPYSYGKMVEDVLEGLNCEISFEPGRIIVGNAGILVAKVIFMKTSEYKNFCIIDGAMNDLIRPTLYESFHKIVSIKEPQGGDERIIVDVVGPICESGDYLARNCKLPILTSGDLIAVRTVGAYGAVMSSTYNSRPLIPEVMVKQNQFAVIRKRVTVENMIDYEQIPAWVK